MSTNAPAPLPVAFSMPAVIPPPADAILHARASAQSPHFAPSCWCIAHKHALSPVTTLYAKSLSHRATGQGRRPPKPVPTGSTARRVRVHPCASKTGQHFVRDRSLPCPDAHMPRPVSSPPRTVSVRPRAPNGIIRLASAFRSQAANLTRAPRVICVSDALFVAAAAA